MSGAREPGARAEAARRDLAQQRALNARRRKAARAARKASQLEVEVRDLQERLDSVAAELRHSERREAELGTLLAEAHELVGRRDDALAEELRTLARSAARPGEGPSRPLDPVAYGQLIARIRERVRALPEDAVVLVVGKGDAELTELSGRRGWHFPQNEDGTYTGYYPATGREAIEQLEALRARGAGFVLFPSTALWWLEHYAELGRHLARYPLVVRDAESCFVFDLREPLPEAEAGVGGEPSSDSARGPSPRSSEARFARELTARSELVLELVQENARLAARARAAELEAAGRSVDTHAKARLRAFLASGARLFFPTVEEPTVSIVIPAFQQAHLTYTALQTLVASGGDVPFEVIVVDNASTDETRTVLGRAANVRVRLNERNAGFGAACNAGAAMARGEFVCFLNSDTVVTPGWLSTLVRTMDRDARCGAVGAKLIHGDGRLQEAGAIIWQDGSTIGYGRGDDPIAPEYSYLREVDFCSAACLLVRRQLFQSLGGFDGRYAPAYYEDADFGLALREAGYRTLYQPLAVVFHMEFGSGGREHAIALQRKNRDAFVEKWRERLASQPAATPRPFTARDRRPGKRILVADDGVPHGELGSGFPRARALLEALADLGYVVSFLPLADHSAPQPATTELEQRGVEVLHGVTDARAKLAERAGLYDAAIVSRPHNAAAIALIKELNPRAAVIYDAEAVFALREIRAAEARGEFLPDAEIEERIRAEVALAARADLVLTVSQTERRIVESYDLGTPVTVWSDSMPVVEEAAGFEARRDLLFVGNLKTAPNADAAMRLLEDVFPKVQPELDCRLLIVGPNPATSLFDAALGRSDGVVLTGFVNDLDRVYRQCRAFVAPHRIAAGVPHKVIEAMAQGVPCVVSELLAAQLEVTDGVEVLVAGEVEEFAAKVVRLYRDEELWGGIQERALELVRRRYDPETMKKRLGELVEASLYVAGDGSTAVKGVRYRELLERVRDCSRRVLPADADIAVISKGDDELLAAAGARGWHFPSDESGGYAGYYPADSGDAIAQLEWLRSRGADYLLVPTPAFWWFNHYPGLTRHLEKQYRSLVDDEETCRIFDLRRPPNGGGAPRSGPRRGLYDTYVENNELGPVVRAALERAVDGFPFRPTISVLMPVFGVEARWVEEAVESVRAQIYPDWELCIADDASPDPALRAYLATLAEDPRINVTFREERGHISAATNTAARMASGEFVALMDNDDLLAPNALYEIVRLLQDHPDADVIYTDEDKIDEAGRRYDPQFKPDWSPELLLGYNYLNHFTCVRRALFEQVDRFRVGYEGSQDKDLLYRLAAETSRIHHVPKVLYHWRALPSSTASRPTAKTIVHESGRRALRQQLSRLGASATTYVPEVARQLGLPINQLDWPDEGPSVAVLVPTYNQRELLTRCVDTIVGDTTYRNYRLVVVDNDSDDPETLTYLDELSGRGISVQRISNEGAPFSFSRLNNRAVERVDEELVLFLNNDVEVIEPRWLSRMVGYLSLAGVGATGARLLFPDGTVQHAGVVLGMHNGIAPAHAFAGHPGDEPSYYFQAEVARPCAAVTAACLLTRRLLFLELGGFDEERFPVSLNDVDFCLRLADRGLRTVYVAGAELLHHESRSRNRQDDPAELARFRCVHGRRRDSYYNPNLSNAAGFEVDTACHLDYERELEAHVGRRPRALLVSHNLSSEGAPKSLYELAAGLHRRGKVEVTALSPVRGLAESWYGEAGIRVRVQDPGRVDNLLEGRPTEAEYETAVEEVTRALEDEAPDVVVVNTLHAFHAADAALRMDLPTIWVVRESYTPEQLQGALNPLALERCERVFADAYRVVFVSRETMQLYRRFESAHNFLVVHNGLDAGAIDRYVRRIDQDEARRRIGAPRSKKVIVNVGTICERKGQHTLAESAALLNLVRDDFCCYLVGLREGDDPAAEFVRPYTDRVHDIVHKHRLEDVVRLVPETEDVYPYLRAADVFAFTSQVEAFSRTVLEAEAFGLPIVTTACAGIAEQVLPDVNALLFGMGDATSLALRVSSLLDDDQRRSLMGRNSRSIVNYLLQYDEMVERYERLILGAWLRAPGTEGPVDRPTGELAEPLAALVG